jgi:hypothetical protein
MLLLDRLRRELRINAGRAKENQPVDIGGVGGMDDIRLDREIVINKIGRVTVIGENAADFRRGEQDRVGTILLEPNLNGDLIAKIDDRSIRLDDFVTPAFRDSERGRSRPCPCGQRPKYASAS